MLCRLEMTSTILPTTVPTSTTATSTTTTTTSETSNKKLFHGTIFDQMFDKIYQQNDIYEKNTISSTFSSNKNNKIIKSKIHGSGLVGTIQYMAPEMIINKNSYTEAVDWWSCGILIFECITRKRLFEGSNHSIINHDIVNCDIKKRLYQYQQLLVDDITLDLLLNLLQKEPNQRYGFIEIKNHPFFSLSNTTSTSTYIEKLYSLSLNHHRHNHNNQNQNHDTSNSLSEKTCLTLPSKDFDNLSTSLSKYKPKEISFDKMSNILRQKRIAEFYSDDEMLIQHSSNHHNNKSRSRKNNSKTDNSRRFSMPQLLESKGESDTTSGGGGGGNRSGGSGGSGIHGSYGGSEMMISRNGNEPCELESFHDSMY